MVTVCSEAGYLHGFQNKLVVGNTSKCVIKPLTVREGSIPVRAAYGVSLALADTAGQVLVR